MKKQLVATNPMLFLLDLQEHIQDGWEIDENEPFNMVFNLNTIGIKKKGYSKEAVESVFPVETKKAGRPKKEA